MPFTFHKFMLTLVILLVCGIVVQVPISCSLHFPEEVSSSSGAPEASSSSSLVNPGSSGIDISSSSIYSSSSGSNDSSSSTEEQSSSSVEEESSSSNDSSSSTEELSSSSVEEESSSSTCVISPVYGDILVDSRDNKEYTTIIINKTLVTGLSYNKTWMAENLNYKPSSGFSKCYNEGTSEEHQNTQSGWLFPEDAERINCGENKYGRLYDWATAMNIDASYNGTVWNGSDVNHQGVCPDGWHIPNKDEWDELKLFIEADIFYNYEDQDCGWDVGTKLKSSTGWKVSNVAGAGVNAYGFAAIGSGYCVNCTTGNLLDASGYYAAEKEEALWWSATEFVNPYNGTAENAYKNKIAYNKTVMMQETDSKGENIYSVRCVKND